ncbi:MULTISPECIES: arginine repressor [Enterococcus]|uniref:Arginine repressor n=1 Tax=Enterococcus alishanensis TaxID=1303817 RepID=A0ABS6TAN8_9ENTE|nr:ArgR family transcriptional regulator [Enterococcus alishanensis]MBV7389958.1 ArgR family transcriptional regulator [Enterococcus alishanensis]
MRKIDRHNLIKKIIVENPIRNQNELMALLNQEGIHATQATISRDIRDLKIVKTIDDTGQPQFKLFQENPEPSEDDEMKRLIKMSQEIIVNVDRVQFMTIVTTLPDNANLVAAVLDELNNPLVVSTMASYDTIFIISRTEKDAEHVQQFLTDPTNHKL